MSLDSMSIHIGPPITAISSVPPTTTTPQSQDEIQSQNPIPQTIRTSALAKTLLKLRSWKSMGGKSSLFVGGVSTLTGAGLIVVGAVTLNPLMVTAGTITLIAGVVILFISLLAAFEKQKAEDEEAERLIQNYPELSKKEAKKAKIEEVPQHSSDPLLEPEQDSPPTTPYSTTTVDPGDNTQHLSCFNKHSSNSSPDVQQVNPIAFLYANLYPLNSDRFDLLPPATTENLSSSPSEVLPPQKLEISEADQKKTYEILEKISKMNDNPFAFDESSEENLKKLIGEIPENAIPNLKKMREQSQGIWVVFAKSQLKNFECAPV